MDTNERIRQEIQNRLQKAEAQLTELPESLQPILEYYQKQPLPNLVKKLHDELVETFPHWMAEAGDGIQAAGFEWYYDGRDTPQALGYGYAKVGGTLNFGDVPVGSNSAAAREDFVTGLELEQMLFGDSGGLDIGAICIPVYDAACTGLEDEADDEWDALVNLYTLRMFYAMHLAMASAVQSETFQKLPVKMPFYLFANNHDWDPFLVYCHSDDPTPAGGDYVPGDSAELEVPELAGWWDELMHTAREQERKAALVSEKGRSAPAEMQAVLLGLPELTAGDGTTVRLELDDIKSFAWGNLCKAEYYQTISFEAFEHLFRLVAQSPSPGMYDIHYPLIYIFVNDPQKAASLVESVGKDNAELMATIADCAKNSLRWAEEDGGYSESPTTALKNSRAAQDAMRTFADL